MQEIWVWFLGWEDPLEKGMAIYSSILAWKIPWKEEPGGLQSMESQRAGHYWATDTFTFPGRNEKPEILVLFINDWRLTLAAAAAAK